MVSAFRKRKDLVVSRLRGMGLPLEEPGGTFYAFPNISSLGLSCVEVARHLLEDGLGRRCPWYCFRRESGRDHIRLSFASSLDDLNQGLTAMEVSIEKLR